MCEWIQCTDDDCNVWMHTDCLEKNNDDFVVYVEQYLVKYYNPVFGKNMHFDYYTQMQHCHDTIILGGLRKYVNNAIVIIQNFGRHYLENRRLSKLVVVDNW